MVEPNANFGILPSVTSNNLNSRLSPSNGVGSISSHFILTTRPVLNVCYGSIQVVILMFIVDSQKRYLSLASNVSSRDDYVRTVVTGGIPSSSLCYIIFDVLYYRAGAQAPIDVAKYPLMER